VACPQYRQLLAFPHLTAREQIDAVLAQDPEDEILLRLMDVAKPLDKETFENLLERACRENDEGAQYRILGFAGFTETVISENARRHLAALIRSESRRVRAETLHLIAKLGDERLIKEVVQSGWNAAALDTDNPYETRYGSAIILEAAARGAIPYNEALNRIAPQFYGWAAGKLTTDAARDVARRMDVSIRTAAELTIDPPVNLELQVRSEDSIVPTLYYASEKEAAPEDTFEGVMRFTESREAFKERQTRAHDAFNAFSADLRQAKARIILDDLRMEQFDVIAASGKTLAEGWYEVFVNLPKPRLTAIHNIGLLLAHALAAWNPRKAAHLFEVLADSKPAVRVNFGLAGVPLDAMAAWSAADDPNLDAFRLKRLDRAANDHELALEVLAALWNGKEALLKTYTEEQLATGEPARIARALMVAGLSLQNSFNDDVLARYRDTQGFIGDANKAAMYAYQRNIWARHWFKKMCEAKDPHEFWRYSILFTEIVDGRFEVWETSETDRAEPFRMFWPSVRSKVEERFNKWEGHRTKTLFGDDAPSRVFLQTDKR